MFKHLNIERLNKLNAANPSYEYIALQRFFNRFTYADKSVEFNCLDLSFYKYFSFRFKEEAGEEWQYYSPVIKLKHRSSSITRDFYVFPIGANETLVLVQGYVNGFPVLEAQLYRETLEVVFNAVFSKKERAKEGEWLREKLREAQIFRCAITEDIGGLVELLPDREYPLLEFEYLEAWHVVWDVETALNRCIRAMVERQHLKLEHVKDECEVADFYRCFLANRLAEFTDMFDLRSYSSTYGVDTKALSNVLSSLVMFSKATGDDDFMYLLSGLQICSGVDVSCNDLEEIFSRKCAWHRVNSSLKLINKWVFCYKHPNTSNTYMPADETTEHEGGE